MGGGGTTITTVEYSGGGDGSVGFEDVVAAVLGERALTSGGEIRADAFVEVMFKDDGVDPLAMLNMIECVLSSADDGIDNDDNDADDNAMAGALSSCNT
ncbi:hypothetical protein BGZ65_008574 [Modicella reniformis]|uniref:Uncharacterized protein n=1 Tax=Modicella reniformis TaxID=1440133 RepID=A0A9P6M226_9FUNG|nr:hypothetical protein BGZ65_008574 [Modicella reniformis]